MNSRQKSYDRYDQINRLMKISNNYYLYRNLEYISNRKGKYPSLNMSKQPTNNKRIITEPYSNYYVIRENEVYQKMINGIRFQPLKQKQKEEDINKRISDYRKHNKKIEDKLLAVKNENYKKRINMQKGVLNTKKYEDAYNSYHLKMVRNIRKIPNTKSVVLPPIGDILKRNASARRIGSLERKNLEKNDKVDTNNEEKKENKKEDKKDEEGDKEEKQE